MLDISSYLWLQFLPRCNESVPDAGEKSNFGVHVIFFFVQTANILRVAAIQSIGHFVLFLGKLAVVIATGFISYEIMRVICITYKQRVGH